MFTFDLNIICKLTNPIMKKSLFNFCLSSVVSVFVLTGCATPPPKSKPEDTVMSGSSRKRPDYVAYSKNSSGDYIDETLAYSGNSYDEPLVPRAESEEGKFSNQSATHLLTSVYFGFDESGINAAERTKLMQAAEQLNANSSQQVLIKGYCDYFGTKEYNLALGERRAISAKRYLEQLGIKASRIETVSMGNLEAQYKGTKEEVAMDRRSDLFIAQ